MSAIKKLVTKHNLDNIPHCLRKLADAIESGEEPVTSIVIVYKNEKDEEIGYGNYGVDMTTSNLIGLLEYAKMSVYEDGQC